MMVEFREYNNDGPGLTECDLELILGDKLSDDGYVRKETLFPIDCTSVLVEVEGKADSYVWWAFQAQIL
ncbi:MAG: hypothetical protein EZS28_033162 [Streblomastix strix]|uniref:Uncharacterized protein n=1 Tax=Streblomastix strix TaxID=222440 RepID=A0A5J4UMK2_9EUKA|nr:MAG: hypothetical protein EZS28_033162 [Streblomastix strix]